MSDSSDIAWAKVDAGHYHGHHDGGGFAFYVRHVGRKYWAVGCNGEHIARAGTLASAKEYAASALSKGLRSRAR